MPDSVFLLIAIVALFAACAVDWKVTPKRKEPSVNERCARIRKLRKVA